MAEVTRTMSEWIEIDQRERRQRRELLKELAEYQKTHPPLMAAFRPRAVSAPPMPPKPDLRPPAELPENPTLSDLAQQLGISPAELDAATGGLSLERMMMLLDVSTPTELLEQLRLIIDNQPKGLNRFERVRAACVKVRLAGRRVGKLMAMAKDKAHRAEMIRKARALRG